MRVFVSTCQFDGPMAESLRAALASAGAEVEHSPRSTDIGPHWYDRDCAEAIGRAEAFVAVVDLAWTCSTWMAIEADAAHRLAQQRPLRTFVWNPQGLTIPLGMRPYAIKTLPPSVVEAVAELLRGAA